MNKDYLREKRCIIKLIKAENTKIECLEQLLYSLTKEETKSKVIKSKKPRKNPKRMIVVRRRKKCNKMKKEMKTVGPVKLFKEIPDDCLLIILEFNSHFRIALSIMKLSHRYRELMLSSIWTFKNTLFYYFSKNRIPDNVHYVQRIAVSNENLNSSVRLHSFSDFSSNFLSKFPNLKHLDVKGCTNVDSMIFEKIPESVTSLNLTDCACIRKSFGVYLHHNIEELIIDGTNLYPFPREFAKRFPKLKVLFMRRIKTSISFGNQIRMGLACQNFKFLPKTLVRLDVSNNNWIENTFFKNLKIQKMDYLNISKTSIRFVNELDTMVSTLCISFDYGYGGKKFCVSSLRNISNKISTLILSSWKTLCWNESVSNIIEEMKNINPKLRVYSSHINHWRKKMPSKFYQLI